MSYKILTVDDSKMVRFIIAKAFQPYGCEVYEAGNGADALATAEALLPDLIFLDITMADMNGLVVLEKMRETKALKSTPVIMLTAESGRDNVLQIARLGVRDYLVKPFKEDQLVEKAGRCVTLVKRAAAPTAPAA